MTTRPKIARGSSPEGLAMCEALGLDPKQTKSIEFRIAADEIVTITVTRNVYDTQVKAFAKVLERFNLVPEEGDEQDITAMGDNTKRYAMRGHDA